MLDRIAGEGEGPKTGLIQERRKTAHYSENGAFVFESDNGAIAGFYVTQYSFDFRRIEKKIAAAVDLPAAQVGFGFLPVNFNDYFLSRRQHDQFSMPVWYDRQVW